VLRAFGKTGIRRSSPISDNWIMPHGCASPRHSFAVNRASERAHYAASAAQWVAPLNLPFPPRRSMSSEAAGRLGHMVKCVRDWLAVRPALRPQPHLIRAIVGVLAWLSVPSSPVPVFGGCRPLRAYGQVRAHLAPGELAQQVRPHLIRGPRRTVPAPGWL